jgi:hypothetical protein
MKIIPPIVLATALASLSGCVPPPPPNQSAASTRVQAQHADGAAALPQPTSQAQSAEKKEDPSDQAWQEVNCLDHDSVSHFLATFPTSSHGDEAKLALVATEKLDALRSKTSAPDYVIPFSKLGKYWEYWAGRPKDFGVVGYGVGGFSPYVGGAGWFPGFTGGKTPGHNTFFNDNNAVPAMHTADGSMAVFKTSGARMGWVSDFHITTPEKERLVLGVVDGVGLVYLSGVGEIVEPDGTVVTLPKKAGSQ